MAQAGGDIKSLSRKYFLSVDVGTTTIRCHVYDKQVRIVGAASETNTVLNPFPGHVEIDPDQLWEKFTRVIKDAVADAGITFDAIISMGISTMRGTFMTWNKDTGDHYHNFITWQDTRSKDICDVWNDGLQLKLLRGVGSILYFVSRRKRFLAASIFRMSTPMVLPRLIWVLYNNEAIREDVAKGKALFGTVDTWLVWKLTKGNIHATDPSNICTSGFYDPFRLKYGSWALMLFNIPTGNYCVLIN